MAANALKSFKYVLRPPWTRYKAFLKTQQTNVRLPFPHSRFFHVSGCYCGDPLRLKMPALSPTMQEGTIVKWYKKEGETVSAGDVLCDIQTDKAVVSLESDEEGILAKIVKPEDSKDIKIGALIALIVEEGEDWQNVAVPAESEQEQPPSKPTATAEASKPAAATSSAKKSASNYGPAVRSLLDQYNIDGTSLAPTGPHGRLLKGDVLDHINKHKLKPASQAQEILLDKPQAKSAVALPTVSAPVAAKPAPPSSTAAYIDVELSNMRKTIAKRLTLSKTTIPHGYCTVDSCIDNLVALRANYKNENIKVSLNDFIIKAVGTSLQQFPQVNAVWSERGPKLLDNIDICVAVATDSGLITPIVTDVTERGVQDISEKVKDLAERARQNKLKLEEFQGGSFTISNLGMFGITQFSAIINPPQACILAVGGSRAVLDPETLQPKTYMSATLCYDTRIVGDDVASQFLQTLKETLEEPMLMLEQKPSLALSVSSLFSKLFAK